MADIVVRSGDRLPVITRTFSVNDSPVNLTGGTVTFTVISPATGATVLTGNATITNAAAGEVQYSWGAGDTATPGAYFAFFTATIAGKNLTAPNDGYLTLLITDPDTSGFSYTGDPQARSLDAVRFLINDTDATAPLMKDAEIEFLLGAAAGSIYQAAHDACYVLAGQFNRLADSTKTVGDLTLALKYTDSASKYLDLAERFVELASRREPSAPWVKPDSLKPADERTTTTGTEFRTGQFDYRWS